MTRLQRIFGLIVPHVVCTQACEADLQTALHDRGHTGVAVAHYGALRGSNAYKGYDVILAQVYHPNTDAVIREGRALFAGDDVPLDEQMVTTERVLEDAAGEPLGRAGADVCRCAAGCAVGPPTRG